MQTTEYQKVINDLLDAVGNESIIEYLHESFREFNNTEYMVEMVDFHKSNVSGCYQHLVDFFYKITSTKYENV